ncbi:MAG: hypothetical protein EOP06_04640 [Proteobacteria bacterium]|nr:MAG: hypothetical protein EOP06_04640 [Pseudomonadota bacterium]
MKSLLSVLMFFLSLGAQAATSKYEVCFDGYSVPERYWTDAINDCLKTVGHGEYQPEALVTCKKFSWPKTRVRCVKAIQNKDYAPGFLEACNRLTDGEALMQCLSQR